MLNPTQYMRFLGGEVSPNLWNMADFDKYGKWFANAENIRFETLGAFKNRTGFVKVANTKNNLAGEKIKLLSFVFNNNESFMIELGKYYFRVFKDGKVITDAEGNPKVWSTNITFDEDEDVKYAQSGDTVFLATGKSPLYEIHRLEVDGSSWEIKEFKFLDDCQPAGEQNTDKSKTVTATQQSISQNRLYEGQNRLIDKKIFTDVTYGIQRNNTAQQLFVDHNLFYTPEDVASLITSKLPAGTVFATNASFSEARKIFSYEMVKPADGSTINSINLSITTFGDEGKSYQIQYPSTPQDIKNLCVDYTERVYGIVLPQEVQTQFGVNEVTLSSEDASSSYVTTSLNKLRVMIETATTTTTPQWSLHYTITDQSSAFPKLTIYFTKKNEEGAFSPAEGALGVLKVLSKGVFTDIANPVEIINKVFTFSFTDEDALKDKTVGDIIMVENYIEAGASSVSNLGNTSGAWRYGDIMKTDGAWSLTSMGNWAGTLVLEYSLSGEEPWKPVTTIQSGSTSAGGNTDATVSNNANQSGTVTAGDNKIIYMRVKAKITAAGTYKLTANAIGRTFTINSYYKIISKTDDKNCVVECVKNDIGEFKNAFAYSFGVFNKKDGYPTAIGFYQNRLILGKGYELWLSKSNDFWDFYEPISVAKDDPINMSLLSYKVNTIKNIVSLRNFFVFSTGAEYGITSEGALSQDDKYLSTLSMHGSISARPIIIGNVVLFVDSSANTVRALRYTFESESYEAEDISIMQELMFKNKKFVTTELLQNEKECLFLDEDGTIWVLKFLPEQEILAWSHWKHAKHKITNLCVVQNGHKNDLYIAVDTENGKQIELMSDNIYLDSSETHYFSTKTKSVITDFPAREKVAVFADDNLYNLEVEENGIVNLPKEAQNVTIGLKYGAEATLLSPVTQVAEGVYTTYNRHKPFKTYFHYRDSYGFKVGAKEEEKMQIDFNLNERHKNPSSGKTSVLFVSKYDGSGQVSFKQEEPYQMNIENILLEVDYGGR